jgi:hypothetical protein
MFETAGILIKALTLAFAFRSADRSLAIVGSDGQQGTAEPCAAASSGPAVVIDIEEHRPKPPPPSAPRKPTVAARRFVSFLQDEGFTGDQRWAGKNGLWDLYLWHCYEENTTPLPNNVFGEALGKIAVKRLVRDYTSGKLQRPTVYHIPEPKQQRVAA